jgi:hypothetical protein
MIAEHAALNEYGPAERRALSDHRYFLGIELGHSPTLEEAMESWERNHAKQWRARKMRLDAEAQVREIEAFRQELVVYEGHHVDFKAAARAWVDLWGDDWRRHREAESLPRL